MPDLLDRADSTFIHLGFKEPQTVGSVIGAISPRNSPVSVYLKQPDGKEIYIPVPANLRSDNIMQIPFCLPDLVSAPFVWCGTEVCRAIHFNWMPWCDDEPGRVPLSPLYRHPWPDKNQKL